MQSDDSVKVFASEPVASLHHAPPGYHWVPLDKAAIFFVQDEADWIELMPHLSPARRAAFPIVSLEPFNAADAIVESGEVGTALETVRHIARRASAFTAEALEADDEALALLLYLASRGSDLEPVSDVSQPHVVMFREQDRFPEIDKLLRSLADKTWVRATFAEAINQCPACRSARLLVRDQCSRCTSSRLKREAVLHHFPCAHQARKAEFEADDGSLRCPKCHEVLHEVADDYEVSSAYFHCLDCKDVATHATAGFRCLDCSRSGNGADLLEREIHAYALTEAGLSVLSGGGAGQGG